MPTCLFSAIGSDGCAVWTPGPSTRRWSPTRPAPSPSSALSGRCRPDPRQPGSWWASTAPTQSSAAIGYAYHAADQRGIGLTALHAWNPRGAFDLDGVIDDVGATEENERRVLDRALEGWERRFPGVSVQARLVRGCPARALITESAGALHSRWWAPASAKGFRVGLVVERTSQILIRSAYGPVAVIRSTS